MRNSRAFQYFRTSVGSIIFLNLFYGVYKFFFKLIFLFILFLSISFEMSFAGSLPSSDIETSIGKVRERYMSLFWAAPVGSGFFITKNLFITNYHIIQDSPKQEVRIESSLGRDVGLIVAIDTENDLTIIKTSRSDHRPVTLGHSIDINRGEEVMIVQPFRRRYSAVQEGVVLSRVGGEFLSTEAPSFSGMSGSPVFSKDLGTVVGIVSFGFNFGRPVIKENTTVAISVDKIRAFIEKNRTLLEEVTGERIDSRLYERSLEKGYDFSKDIKTPVDMFFMGTVMLYSEEQRKD